MYVGSDVLTAVVINSTIFWDITPCSPFKVNRRFGGIYQKMPSPLRPKIIKILLKFTYHLNNTGCHKIQISHYLHLIRKRLFISMYVRYLILCIYYYLFKLQMGFYPVAVYYSKTQHTNNTPHSNKTQHTKRHKQ
jgi:hypothetical protein